MKKQLVEHSKILVRGIYLALPDHSQTISIRTAKAVAQKNTIHSAKAARMVSPTVPAKHLTVRRSSMRGLNRSIFSLALTTVALFAAQTAAAQNYSVTDLGTLPGQAFTWNWQQTINNNGVVANYTNNANNPDAFSGDLSYLWKDGNITPLPGLPGATDTIAFSLNDRGQVVGRCTVPGSPNFPVMWDHGVIQTLPELAGDDKGGALEINNSLTAVGYSANSATGIRRAVMWRGGKVTQLEPVVGGGMYDEAFGINERGDIVGLSGPANGSEHVALWQGGPPTDLGTLGGPWGDGYAINDKGMIVGQSAIASGVPYAFLYENGTMTNLGVLGVDAFSGALGINKRGQVVGYSGVDPNDITTWHALLWHRGETLNLQARIDPKSGWTLLAASGINDHGTIDGVGLHNGQIRAFVLTPRDDDHDGR